MKIDEQLAEALREVRRENTYRMNHIRAVGTGAFAAVCAPIAFFVEWSRPDNEKTWFVAFCGATVYFSIAYILLLASRAYPTVRRLSRFAIPVLDIPIVVAIQALAISNAQINPGHVSEFSISLLACLVLISAFTVDLRQIGFTIAVAILGEQFLQHLAGISLGGRIASVLVFAMVGWICVFAGRNRVELVHRVTRANARRTRLQRYFSPGVGELIEEHDDDAMAQGRECDLTIVFTDIRGFTRISENLSGPEIIGFLNHYHARMVAAVFKHGGTLDKYLGDGLMIYFNAPVAQQDHAYRAIHCALEMQREIAALNAEHSWHGQDEDELRIGIGIHSGRAVLGDIGAPHRREFTAIGDSVNVAARLQEMTKEFDHDLLVSRATADLAAEEFTWTPLGRIPLRNRNEEIEVLSPSLPEDTPE